MQEYQQALQTSEAERESLERHAHSGMTTPTNKSSRACSLDTPSKDVVLHSEPHGEEFEYFKNVLFEYMMGRQTKQLPRVIAALARFSETQKKQLESRSSYF